MEEVNKCSQRAIGGGDTQCVSSSLYQHQLFNLVALWAGIIRSCLITVSVYHDKTKSDWDKWTNSEWCIPESIPMLVRVLRIVILILVLFLKIDQTKSFICHGYHSTVILDATCTRRQGLVQCHSATKSLSLAPGNSQWELLIPFPAGANLCISMHLIVSLGKLVDWNKFHWHHQIW